MKECKNKELKEAGGEGESLDRLKLKEKDLKADHTSRE